MIGCDRFETIAVVKPLDTVEMTKTVLNTTIHFHALKKNADGGYELKIGVAQDDDKSTITARNLMESGQLVGTNARVFHSSVDSHHSGDNGVEEYVVTYSTDEGKDSDGNTMGEPAKWILELPAKTRFIKVPVEFTDLPLP